MAEEIDTGTAASSAPGNGTLAAKNTQSACRTIPVSLGSRSYEIIIGTGLMAQAGELIAPLLQSPLLCIVTDHHVETSWRAPLQASLSQAGIESRWFVLPPGEASKSWEKLALLCHWLLENGVERRDTIVALGGGVVGDLTGFASAILKRGCNFIQIPTTLLAQVDSSVGGKTAIDVSAGKNLIGAFHQPSLVLADSDSLATLPERQMRAGYAETVKIGLIGNAPFFQWCEQHYARVIAGDADALAEAVAVCVAAKAAIVADDEEERSGARALLNLGHTFAHALEAETGFGEGLLHGEAVGCGMALAAQYSARRGVLAAGEAARICGHLASAGLPVTLADAGISASGEQLTAHMLHDKKREGGTLPFVLLRAIGNAYLDSSVKLGDVAKFLDEPAIRGE